MVKATQRVHALCGGMFWCGVVGGSVRFGLLGAIQGRLRPSLPNLVRKSFSFGSPSSDELDFGYAAERRAFIRISHAASVIVLPKGRNRPAALNRKQKRAMTND